MGILDIVVLAFIGIFAVIGFSKGFIKSLIGLIGGLLSAVLAYFLCASCVELLNDLVIIEGLPLSEHIEALLVEKISEFSGAPGAENIFSAVPEGGYTESLITESLTLNGIPAVISSLISPLLVSAMGETALPLSVFLAKIFTSFIMSAIGFLLMFIIISVVLNFVTNIVNKIFSLPIIGVANRLLGLLFGALKAVLLVWVILFFASLVGLVAGPMNDLINGTTFVKFLSDNNVITMLLGNGLNVEETINRIIESASEGLA